MPGANWSMGLLKEDYQTDWNILELGLSKNGGPSNWMQPLSIF
jgi:hypothetical protein